MRSLTVLVVLGLLALAATSSARTWHVDRDGTGDFTTIQPAVDAAAPGDTISIGPGEYTEYQTIRPPLWDWDIDIYAYVATDNLTIIGAGVGETIIGSPVAYIDYQRFSPETIWAGNVDSLAVYDLTVRNSYTGIYGPNVAVNVGRSRFDTVNQGVFCFAQIVKVDQCEFIGVGNSPKAVWHTPSCSYSRIRNCTIRGCSIYLETVEDYYIGDCSFTGGMGAASILDWSVGIVERCVIDHVINVSFNIDVSRCTMRNVDITGGRSGIWMQGGELTATGINVRETTNQAFLLYQPIEFVIHASNILPSSGLAMKFESYSGSPSETYDCTGNYWGVADSTAIAELIWDGRDLPTINDYIGFVPFEMQLDTQRRSLGSVRSLFRSATQ